MDIAFGDCVSVGGYCYALILVSCATQYNWTLASRLCPQRTLYLQSVSFVLRLVHWHVAFTQTVILIVWFGGQQISDQWPIQSRHRSGSD
jgi:hypothetical protein